MKSGPMTQFGHRWTAEESRVLRKAYTEGGLVAAQAALPHRSALSLRHRARVLGVNLCRRWTREEDRAIHDGWGTVPITAIARRVSRSVLAVWLRARAIGLKTGCPRGLEYIDHAARRTGFEHSDLVRVLRWAGVKPMKAFTSPEPGRQCPRRVVDPLDVDIAVEAWMRTETLSAAARRLHVAGATMLRWVRESGADLGRRTSSGSRSHFRVDPEIVDRIVADRRRRETLTDAARRVGLHKAALAKRLLIAGVAPPKPGSKRHVWLLEPEFVDRVIRDWKERTHGTIAGESERGSASEGDVCGRDGGGDLALERSTGGAWRIPGHIPDVAAE